MVGVVRLRLAVSFVALGVLAGCGLGLGGEGAEDAPDDASTAAPDAAELRIDSGATHAADASPSREAASPDDGSTAGDDQGSTGDDAQAVDDNPGDDASEPDSGPPPAMDAGDPCAALQSCCDQIKKISPSGAGGCENGVKSSDPGTCATVLADLEGTGLCH
ncbi:MAG TPA: hypothetical protein VHV30_03065 [Polyangiaceae bacterium]|nr:hypothetical protein [Polyangiaceae bacterium]